MKAARTSIKRRLRHFGIRRLLAVGTGVFVVLGVVVVVIVVILWPSTGPAPWSLPDHPRARVWLARHSPLAYLGGNRLPPYANIGGEIPHGHVHLDIFVDGVPTPVPARLGLEGASAALHTHSDSGIIHMESSDLDATYTLRQLFRVWGVRLSDRCIGSYCAPDTPVRAYVNGREHGGDLRRIVLKPYSQISLVIGRPPPSIPDRYDCHTAADSERRSCRPFVTGRPVPGGSR